MYTSFNLNGSFSLCFLCFVLRSVEGPYVSKWPSTIVTIYFTFPVDPISKPEWFPARIFFLFAFMEIYTWNLDVFFFTTF